MSNNPKREKIKVNFQYAILWYKEYDRIYENRVKQLESIPAGERNCTPYDTREERNKNRQEEIYAARGLGTDTTNIENKLRWHKEELGYEEPYVLSKAQLRRNREAGVKRANTAKRGTNGRFI